MKSIYAVLVVVVILCANETGDALVDQVKKVAKKVTDVGEKINDKLIGQAIKQFCEHSGDLGAFAGKGFGFIKCDADHKSEEHCNFVGNVEMLYGLICGMTEDHRKEAFTVALKCFSMTQGAQECMEGWWKIVKGFAETAEFIAENIKKAAEGK